MEKAAIPRRLPQLYRELFHESSEYEERKHHAFLGDPNYELPNSMACMSGFLEGVEKVHGRL